MSLPVRCFTCNKIIGNKEEEWNIVLAKKLDKKETLDRWGMRRICCRRMFLGYVNMVDQLILSSRLDENDKEKK